MPILFFSTRVFALTERTRPEEAGGFFASVEAVISLPHSRALPPAVLIVVVVGFILFFFFFTEQSVTLLFCCRIWQMRKLLRETSLWRLSRSNSRSLSNSRSSSPQLRRSSYRSSSSRLHHRSRCHPRHSARPCWSSRNSQERGPRRFSSRVHSSSSSSSSKRNNSTLHPRSSPQRPL